MSLNLKNKKYIYGVLFLLVLIKTSVAQNCSDLKFKEDTINFKSEIEIAKHENLIKKCAECFLSYPLNSLSFERNNLMVLLIKYMVQNPEHPFTDVYPHKLFRGNSYKEVIFDAILIKLILENKNIKISNKELFILALTSYINYCENPKNKVRRFGKELKKIIDYQKSGQLELYYYELKQSQSIKQL